MAEQKATRITVKSDEPIVGRTLSSHTVNEAREKIAKALYEVGAVPPRIDGDREEARALADVVLAALGVEQEEGQ